MSDESTTTEQPKRESLSETLDRLVGSDEPEGAELDSANLEGDQSGRFGLSLANFPTADVPSQKAIVTPIQLEQSGPSKLAVGQHKRIHTPIGKRASRGGPKEPQTGHRV